MNLRARLRTSPAVWTAPVWVGKGRITFTGATQAFLARAPQDTPAARRAEAAYTAVSALATAQESW
ncbi:hypothetical protein [Streptomyces parvulus]|uniref:hypothetical protein n=1 Tax=Streptomyces parvulus TaxID=146923 RepID=UPI0011C0699A|nr:hypothetical protein [Streptomyces parvulus]